MSIETWFYYLGTAYIIFSFVIWIILLIIFLRVMRKINQVQTEIKLRRQMMQKRFGEFKSFRRILIRILDLL
jgi:hypothetical protein